MATCLVTGGAGFIGSHIAQELVRQGHRVRVLDNFSTGKRENLLEFEQKIEVIVGDIRNIDLVREATKDTDYMFHQAALPSVPRSIADPISTNAVNIDGTLNVLVAARDADVRRVIYASSSSVYGDTPTLPKREYMIPHPVSPYAITKLVGEYYCKLFSHLYGLETVILRYFNVFGPRQDPNSEYAAVIPKFIKALLNSDRPVIYGDGEQSRDFTYIDDVVQANILAMQAPRIAGEVFNIAGGRRLSVNGLVEILKKIAAKEVNPVYTNARPGDVKHSLADISRASTSLGYKPVVSWEEGLQRTFDWFRKRSRRNI